MIVITGATGALNSATVQQLLDIVPADEIASVREAAVDVGAQRILYTSQQGAHEGNPFPPARSHAAVEALLADSGTACGHGFSDGYDAAGQEHSDV